MHSSQLKKANTGSQCKYLKSRRIRVQIYRHEHQWDFCGFFSLYGASSALAALHVNKYYRLCARFKRGGIDFDSIKLGPVFQAKKSNEFTRRSLTNKNHMDYVYSSLMLLLDFDSLQSPSSHPSFLCFANEKVKQNTSLDRQQAWVHESNFIFGKPLLSYFSSQSSITLYLFIYFGIV